MEDRKIIELFLARNEDAIRFTAESYGGRLFSLADNILRNGRDAEECVSDTYMRSWDTIPPQRPRHFFAYLAKICRHFALDRLDWKSASKRKAEVICLTQVMENCIPDQIRDRELESREIGRLLDTFLKSQTPENRMVFMRRFWYLDSIAEISVRYGISEAAVQKRITRMKSKLAAFLEQEGISV